MVRGGHLAVMNSRDEFDMIRTMLLQYRASESTVRAFWVDGTDRLTPNAWFCATMQGACPWIEWATGQGQNEGEDCACVWYTSHHADGLADISCTDARPLPVCEFDCEDWFE